MSRLRAAQGAHAGRGDVEHVQRRLPRRRVVALAGACRTNDVENASRSKRSAAFSSSVSTLGFSCVTDQSLVPTTPKGHSVVPAIPNSPERRMGPQLTVNDAHFVSLCVTLCRLQLCQWQLPHRGTVALLDATAGAAGAPVERSAVFPGTGGPPEPNRNVAHEYLPHHHNDDANLQHGQASSTCAVLPL